MNKLPKLIESWEEGNTIVEIWEEVGPLPNNSNCDSMHYSLRIISKDSRKFPVLTGAIRQAKEILKRKIIANCVKLRRILTKVERRNETRNKVFNYHGHCGCRNSYFS